MLLMEDRRGGRASLSFKEVSASRGKKPLESTKGASEEEKKLWKRRQQEEIPKKSMAQRTRREKTKNRALKTRNKRDPANPKLRSLQEPF